MRLAALLALLLAASPALSQRVNNPPAGGGISTNATMGRTATPITGGDLSPNTYIIFNTIPTSGTINQFKIFGGSAGGTAYIRTFTKSGNVYTQVGTDVSFSYSASVLNTFTAGVPVTAGQYLGFAVTGAVAYTATTPDNGGFYYHAGNQTSVDTTSGTTLVSSGLRLEVSFNILTVTCN